MLSWTPMGKKRLQLFQLFLLSLEDICNTLRKNRCKLFIAITLSLYAMDINLWPQCNLCTYQLDEPCASSRQRRVSEHSVPCFPIGSWRSTLQRVHSLQSVRELQVPMNETHVDASRTRFPFSSRSAAHAASWWILARAAPPTYNGLTGKTWAHAPRTA